LAVGVQARAQKSGPTMRALLIFAVAILIAGIYGARFADHALISPPRAAAVQPAAQARDPETYSSTHNMVLDADRLGHFSVDVRVDGRQLGFLVDTGASFVTLRESDAAYLGIRPMPIDYKMTMNTANGRIKAAPIKLSRVEIGDIMVFDVPAMVLPDEALATNLLGVSFLSKLRRYEFANGRMVLEQ
jgi:aspartyl protease family protein